MPENIHVDAIPKISIVMGVFRGLESLSVTVESILQQTFQEIEIVIVDDGNCPADSALICEVATRDARIRVIHLKENSGLTKALVVGCEFSRGQYIARIDNGDLMVPESRLEQQHNALENQQRLSLVGGGVMYLDLLNMGVYRSRKMEAISIPFKHGDAELKRVTHVTVMFRTASYRIAGGYNEALKTGQDVDLWPRILEHGTGLLMNEVYAVAPMRPESISVAQNNTQLADAQKREISRMRSEGFSFRLLSTICMNVVKRLIPLSTRVKLRYRMNFDYLGKYSSDDTSLAGVSTWYRANFVQSDTN